MRVTRIPCLTLSRRTLTGLRPWQNQPLWAEGEVMSARSRVPDAMFQRLPRVVLYDMTVEACTRLGGSYLTSWRQAEGADKDHWLVQLDELDAERATLVHCDRDGLIERHHRWSDAAAALWQARTG